MSVRTLSNLAQIFEGRLHAIVIAFLVGIRDGNGQGLGGLHGVYDMFFPYRA